jgi:hypothetical protein
MKVLLALLIACGITAICTYVTYKICYRIVDSHPEWWRKKKYG